MMKASSLPVASPFKVRLWILSLAIVGLIYLPLLFWGGIICDDWGDIRQTWDCIGFFNCYREWFPLFSNRPLAPLPITLSTQLFSTHYSWYVITNTLIYLVALGLTTRALRDFLGSFALNTFFILAAVPCIAMPVIASPINQLTATVAFLYWAISINLLRSFCQNGRPASYVLSYLILLCGFLTYEIILPLLLLTAFIPALLKPQNLTKRPSKQWLTYFVQFIMPILGVLLLVILWQKVLAPQFMEVFSRLDINGSHLLRNLYTWISVFIFQLPKLFIKAIPAISLYELVVFLFIGAFFYLGMQQEKKQQGQKLNWGFFWICLASFVSSSLIFILSDQSAVSWGYQARGLSSTWFALAILLACLTQMASLSTSKIRLVSIFLIVFFTCFSALSFSIQRDKYIESWQLQMHILGDAVALIKKQAIGPNASIIGNVPRYTPNNYNRELVFSQSWDFPAALVLYAQNQVRGGIVVDSRGNDLQNLRIENGIATVNDKGIVDFTNLWLYDYEPKTNKGELSRIKNSAELQVLITQWQQK